MGYIDLAIAISAFILFLSFILVLSFNYFSKQPSFLKIPEYQRKAIDFFEKFFTTKGTPENWEETGVVPYEPGVLIDLYRIPVVVRETAGLTRENEPVSITVTFDEDCINTTWNTTVRVYDEDVKEIKSNISEQIFCISQYLNQSVVSWNVNLSSNQIKKFFIFSSPDEKVSSANYSISYNTTSWIPDDGDSWTESTNNWVRYEGTTGTVTLDSTNKKVGSYNINMTGTFSSNSLLGLEYNPTGNITGVSNGWYLRAWVFIDNIAGLTHINISISDNSAVITKNITEITNNSWYLFEENLSSSNWANWTNFNASNGIDFVRFFAVNSTSGLTRNFKIDGLRFEKKPLQIEIFPQEKIEGVSSKKLKALKNMTYEELKKVIGGDYKIRIEISESP